MSVEMVVLGTLQTAIVVLLAMAGWILRDIKQKVDAFPRELADVHKRVSDTNERVAVVEAGVKHLEEGGRR